MDNLDITTIIENDIPRRILNGEFSYEEIKNMVENATYASLILGPYITYVTDSGTISPDMYEKLVRMAYENDDRGMFTTLHDFIHIDEAGEELQNDIIHDVILESILDGYIAPSCLYYLHSTIGTRIAEKLKRRDINKYKTVSAFISP